MVVPMTKTVKIQTHKMLGANIKMFLDAFEYKSVWNSVDEDTDELIVFTDGDTKFLESVKAEAEGGVFVPYQFSVSPKNKGKKLIDDTVEFVGKMSEIREFQNVSGKFRIVLFESNGFNFLWKVYSSEKDLKLDNIYTVKGRVVCMLEGLKGENLVLINFVRLKELEVL
jgi:hypothetical protein